MTMRRIVIAGAIGSTLGGLYLLTGSPVLLGHASTAFALAIVWLDAEGRRPGQRGGC